MRAAFHFDSNDERFGNHYGPPIKERLFRALLEARKLGPLHVRIRVGDLLLWSGEKTLDPETVVKRLLFAEFPVWFTLDPEAFLSALRKTTIYVLDVAGLSPRQATRCDELLADRAYQGALQIQPANPWHWAMYDQSLIPAYRIHGTDLRMLHTADVAEEDRNTGMLEHWKSLSLFDTVAWENIGVRGTIFDEFDTYDHARRHAEVQSLLSEYLEGFSDQLLLRAEDLDPRLAEGLHAAFSAFETVDSAEDLAHVAVSCRRFLKRLADSLFPARDELLGERKVGEAEYRNRLWAYVEEHASGTAGAVVLANLLDVGNRIDRVDELGNKGIHASIDSAEVQHLLVSLVLIAMDLISLDHPPYEASLDPYEDRILEMTREMFGKTRRED